MSERLIGVGIDLGTSNSSVCRLDVGAGLYDYQQLRGDGTATEIPSVVAYGNGRFHFGRAAERREASSPDQVLRNMKLLLRENELIALGDGEFEPVELLRHFLAHLKEGYESFYQTPMTRAVITVPAFEQFDFDYQERIRQAVRGRDGENPLFEDVVTIKEPDAVLMTLIDLYKLVDERILVFDMGGGTLDVSIREVVDNPDNPDRPILRSLAITGSNAAGVRMTDLLGHWVLDQWQRRNRFTFSEVDRVKAIRANFGMFDEVKRQLSAHGLRDTMTSTRTEQCHVDYARPGTGEHYFDIDVSVSTLTELSKPLCEEAMETVEKAVAEAGVMPSEIDSYFVVGGASQLPYMQHLLSTYFGKPAVVRVSEQGLVDPYLAISRGAATYDRIREAPVASSPSTAGVVPNTAPILEQLLPYDLSLLVNSQQELKVLVDKGTALPHGQVTQTFYMPCDDTTLDLHVFRGSGSVAAAEPLVPRRVTFPGVVAKNTEITVAFSVDEAGTMTITALDSDGAPLQATLAS